MLKTLRKRIAAIPISVFAFVIIVILVLGLWLPFGIKAAIGVFEEWTIIDKMWQGQDTLFVADIQPTRPLVLGTYALLTMLSSADLFMGYNLLFIGFFIAKAWIVYLLLRRLIPQNPYIALLAATLFIIYPADTGLFTFRATGSHLSTVMGLFAIYLLVRCWEKPSKTLWVGIAISQLICLLNYEAMYPSLFAATLLLLWMNRRFTRRFWRVTALWSLIPAMLFIWVLFNIAHPGGGDNYVEQRVIQAQEAKVTDFRTMTRRVLSLYERQVSEWGVALESIPHSPYLPLALVLGAVVGIVGWSHFNHIHQKRSRGANLALLAAGFAIIMIGHLPFLLLPYEGVHWRVYLMSSLGAALFLSTLVYWILWRLPIVAVAFAGGLVALAGVSALNQHGFYADASVYVQRLLAGIIAQAPKIDPTAEIVVMDDTGIYESQWVTAGFDTVLSSGVGYLYGHLTKAAYCNSNYLSDWGGTSCDMQMGGIHRVFFEKESMIPYNQAIIFRVKNNGEVELVEQLPGAEEYNPHLFIDDAPPPDLVKTLFTCWPLDKCLPLNSPPQEEIRLDFNRMVRGGDWESGDPDRQQLLMRGKRSTIIINPVTDKPLEIRFRISFAIGQDVIDSLKLEVNGHPVKLENFDTVNRVFSAIIPAEFLQPETELAFEINRVFGPNEWGLEFDWLEVKPLDMSHYVRIEFDTAINGTGWEAPIPDRSQLWMLDTRATMNLNLSTDKDLQIRFKIDLFLQQDILNSLRLTVNGQSIALEKTEGTDLIFRGLIPKSVLRDETELAFYVDRVVSPSTLGINSDTRGLGLLFDWLEIRAAP